MRDMIQSRADDPSLECADVFSNLLNANTGEMEDGGLDESELMGAFTKLVRMNERMPTSTV